MSVQYPCYFGAWDPANDNFTDWSGMQKFNAAPLKSSSMYIGWNTPYSYFGAFNDLCASHGAVMYLNIEPWNAYGGGSTPTMAQIGSGAGDAYLTQLATDLHNAGHQVLMCFAHEMNGNWYPWGSQAISASQWVTTWKHVYTLMKNIMGSLLVGVWCPNNNDVGAVTPYWPGSSFVDLAAADMYINSQNQTFASFNQGTVNEIKSLTSGPIWNAETGIVLGTYSITSWVNDMANAGLYGFTFWNEGSFAFSSGNIATLCAAVNAWNNAAPTGGGVVTSTGGLVRNPPTFNGGTSGNNNPGGSSLLSIRAVGSDQVGATAGIAKSATSFTPPAGSMVRVCATWLTYTNETNVTFTVTDNLGNNYTATAVESDAFGSTYALIFDFQYTTSPGPITLIIDASNTGVADCLVQPYIVTGQATNQAGAAVAKANAASSASTAEIVIQNSQAGSYITMAAGIGFNSTATVVSGTTTDSDWNDTNAGDHGIIGHTTSLSGSPGSITVGWTQSPTSSFGYCIAAAEIIPAAVTGTTTALTVSPVSPDKVSAVSGVATSVTTFSPAAGSLVRVCASYLNANDTLGETFTCADNHGNTYTATLAGGDSDGGCYLLVFDFVYSSAPGNTTVHVTCSNTSGTADCLIQPYLITGQAASYAGAHNSVNGNTSITTTEVSLTPTQIGSVVFVLGAPNNANHPVPTALGTTQTDSEWDDDNVGSHGVLGRSSAITASLTSTTYGWTLSTASVFGFGCAAAEVLPAVVSSSNTGSLAAGAPKMSGTGSVSGGAIFTAKGTIGSATANGFSLAPNSANAGDFILLGVWSETSADWATAISGSNVTWTVLVAHTSFTAQAGVQTLFKGQPSSTSSAAQTITFNTGAPVIRVAWQEFNSATGFGTVTLDASGTVDTASNGHYPSVTPTRVGDMYWSFCFDSGTVAAGNTSGCVYQADASGNGMVYKLFCDNAALQPNTGNTDGLSGIGVMLYQNVVNVQGGLVRNGAAVSGSGVTGIVNVSGTGSLQLGANTYTALGAGTPLDGVVATTFPNSLLSIKAEILINSSWIDISQYVYMRNDMIITRGLPNETQETIPSQMTFTLNNRDGRFSANNPNGAYAPYLTRNTQVRFSIVNQASNAGFLYTGYRFWGELANIPPSWDSTGTDVYVQAQVNGPLRRYIQGAKMGSAMYQYYFSLAGGSFAPYAVWPVEDGNQATEIASMLPGVPSMTFTGKPSFAQNNTFGGTDPLGELNGSIWHGQTNAAADPPGSGSILNNSPGTYNWIAPPGVTVVTSVTATGSGGGGGDTDGTTGGSGGGGGGTGSSSSIGVTPGGSYTYVVPAGGSAGSGGAGSPGAAASFTGDNGVSVSGGGGGGGGYAGASPGTGGSGTHTGGAGAAGQNSTSANFQNTIYGSSGSDGGGIGSGGSSGNNSTQWTAPPTVTTATVNAVAGGGGASAGRGNTGSVGGGNGGGGGAFATGTVTVTPGHSYTVYAGNGGRAGSGSPGGGFPGPSNSAGETGANSGMTGDSSTSVIAGGGGGGASGGPGNAGNVVNGGGNSGGSGGAGTHQVHGGGGSGGGPGTSGGFGTNGANGDGDSGGANRVGGDGGSVGKAGINGSEYGNYGAGGGGGGCNATLNGDGFYGPSGGGGAGGYTNWQWTVTGAPSGGGGGGAASSSANGSAGSTNGNGGGTTGGSAGGSPSGRGNGGGGAGAVPANSTVGNTATGPGSGANGAVGFSWSGGVTSPVANNYIRFCLEGDSQGSVDGAVIFRVLTYGTVARLDVVYHTGGKLQLIGYNSSSVALFDSGSIGFNVDGNQLYMSLELVTNGSTVNWAVKGIAPGGTQLAAAASGTVTGSVGNVSDVLANPNGTITNDMTIGWITVQGYADDLLNLSTIVSGYNGELAADRIKRLCASQGLGFVLVGSNTDTPQMGPQQDDTFLNVLQSCADFDRGQLFETITQFGIGYRTRVSMQGQAPKVIALYANKTLAVAPQPVADDQYTRNDVTMTRNNGASARVSLTSGPMSTQNPPNGVGDYTYGQTVFAYADTQLTSLAQWVVDLGTVAGYRFPQITFDLSRSASLGSLFSTIPTLDIGDYLQIPDPPTFLQTSPIDQLVWGYTETLNSRKWIIQYNTVPETPYAMANPPTW